MEAVFNHADGEVQDVRPPALAGAQPFEKRLLECAEFPVVVLGLAEHRRIAGQFALGVDEIGRVQGPPAVVALIASGVHEPAVGAGPLHIPVGEESPRLVVEELLGHLAVQIPVVEEFHEEVLGHLAVSVGAGGRVQVVLDPEVLPVLDELLVVAVHDLLRCLPFFVGANGDRGAVHIAAGNHQHVVAKRPVIPGEDVRRQVGPGEMTEVARSACVRPGDGNQDLLGGGVRVCHGRRC